MVYDDHIYDDQVMMKMTSLTIIINISVCADASGGPPQSFWSLHLHC